MVDCPAQERKTKSRRHQHRLSGGLPSAGSALVAIALVLALTQGTPPKASGPNTLVLPGGRQIQIQRTSANTGFLSPYSTQELSAGGAPDEHCPACDAQAATGITGGQSVQPGQMVNPASGDFTKSLPLSSVPIDGANIGLTMTYSSDVAQTQIVAGSSSAFGYGWYSSDFPSISLGATDTVNEPNGSAVAFTPTSGTTCPAGDYSTTSRYTGSASTQNYCAPYRVDGQLSYNGGAGGGYEFQGNGQKLVMFFDQFGDISEVTDAVNSTLGIYGSFKYFYIPTTPGGNYTCPSTVNGSPVGSCLDLVTGVDPASAFEFDATGHILGFTDPQGRQFGWTWGTTGYNNGTSTTYSPVPASISDPTSDWGFAYAGSTIPVTVVALMADVTAIADPNGSSMTAGYNNVGMATSTSDFSANFTTTYSYLNTTCSPGQCGFTAAGQSQTTTVGYPSDTSTCNTTTFVHCREVDSDNYTQGVLTSDAYGNPASGPDEQVAIQTTFPVTGHQDDPISELVTHTPAHGIVTNATITTDAVGNVLTVIDTKTNLTTYFYNDAVNNLDELCWIAPPGVTPPPTPTCTVPASTGYYSHTYDGWGRMMSSTDPLGNTTNVGYYNDISGEALPLVCWVAPPLVVATGGGSCVGGPTQNTDPAGTIPTGSTAFDYDALGDTAFVYAAANEADQTISAATYNNDKQVLTSYSPDACPVGSGLGSSSVCAPNTAYKTSHLYNLGNGLAYQMTVPNGNGGTIVTGYNYDADGNVLQELDTQGATTTVYDANNRPCWSARSAVTYTGKTCTSVEVASTTKHQYLADTAAVTQTTDPNANKTVNTYADPAYPTSPTEIQDPLSKDIVHNTYDDSGNLCVTGPINDASCAWVSGDIVKAYDPLNNLMTSEDALGYTTTYTYANTTFPTLETKVTDPLLNVTQYWYDGDGHQNQVQDAGGNYTSTGYDADGRKCWQAIGLHLTATCATPPTGTGSSTFAYDFLGNPLTMVDNNGNSSYPSQATSSYAHDADGNVTSATDDNGKIVTYSYFPGDFIKCVSYPISTSQNCANSPSTTNTVEDFTYTKNDGLMNQSTDWLGKSIAYGWTDGSNGSNGLPNLKTVTYPTGSGETVTYGYDNTNIVTSTKLTVPSITETWGLNNDNLVKATTQLNSYGSSPVYDGTHNWIQSNSNPGSSGADTYTYAANGELKSDAPFSGPTVSYNYNSDAEITSATNYPTAGTTSTFTYNADGQRCWSAPTSGSSCASPPSGATSYAWNAFGELCGLTKISSTINCASASPPTGVTTYSYDGNGLRMQQTLGGTSPATEDFTWNRTTSSGVPALLEDGSNAYLYGPLGTPVEQIALPADTIPTYLVSTPAGMQAEISNSGSSIYTTDYSTYGVAADTTGTSSTPFGFQGGYTDPSGLIYLHHRYYDPSTAQFISVDPAVAQTAQPFSYGCNDPVNYSDPSGLGPSAEQTLQGDVNAATWFAWEANNSLQQAMQLQLGAEWLQTGADNALRQGNDVAAFEDAVGAEEWRQQALSDIASARADIAASKLYMSFLPGDQEALYADKYPWTVGPNMDCGSNTCNWDSQGNLIPAQQATLGKLLSGVISALTVVSECAYGASWGAAAGTFLAPGFLSVLGAAGGCYAGVRFGAGIPPNAPGPDGN